MSATSHSAQTTNTYLTAPGNAAEGPGPSGSSRPSHRSPPATFPFHRGKKKPALKKTSAGQLKSDTDITTRKKFDNIEMEIKDT